MNDKCFCHFGGYQVKDATARTGIEQLTGKANTQAQKISVLEGRVNTLVAMPEGATTNDAELGDIRIAHDGVTYETAGEAVRGQFNDLGNLTWVNKKAIRTQTTNIGDVLDIAANTLGFPSYRYAIINCVEGESFELIGRGGSAARLYAWLDKDDVLLGVADDAVWYDEPVIIVAPAGAAKLILNPDLTSTARLVRLDRVNGKILKRIPVYNNIEEMVAEFTEHDGLCYVLNDNSYYCQGYKGNYYRYDNVSRFAEPELANGGCAVLVLPEFAPVKSNAECVEHILDIAYSYMGKGVSYVSSNGPFANDVSHLTGIQCSQFANAIIQGLPYENSRLSSKELSTNQFVDGGCRWLDVPEYVENESGCLSASELAHFAAAHGWLQKTASLANVQPGDLVFFGQNGTYPGTDNTYYELMWGGISHVAVCVARVGNKTLLVNAGSIAKVEDSSGNAMMSDDVYRLAENDAVNFQTILTDKDDYATISFFMYGFARFPLNYRNLSETETQVINTALGD